MNIYTDAATRMEKSYSLLTEQYKGLRSTSSGGWLDSLKVEYYGSLTPVNQLASVTTPYPGKITIKAYDSGCIKDIERAIQKANLGVGVTSDKNGILVSIPRMTMDQREKLAERATSLANDSKVAVRQIRQDARKSLLKAELSEDEEKSLEKQLQKLTDDYCEKIEKLGKAKSNALMEG
jgi:ribosome recycling factor